MGQRLSDRESYTMLDGRGWDHSQDLEAYIYGRRRRCEPAERQSNHNLRRETEPGIPRLVGTLLWNTTVLMVPAGKTKDGEEVTGSISIPEVAHDTEPDEYVVRFFTVHPVSVRSS